eukprot:15073523-Ditylum_brightwellii.AAC.1
METLACPLRRSLRSPSAYAAALATCMSLSFDAGRAQARHAGRTKPKPRHDGSSRRSGERGA